MWRTLIGLSLVFIGSSCDTQKEETGRLNAKVNSLKMELEMNEKAMKALQEVGSLMDSIDADRLVLKTRMMEGTSFDDYTFRMRSIVNYIHEAQERIALLENKIQSFTGSNSGYKSAIEKLKSHVEQRNQDLVALQETVAQYRNKNDNLIQTVTLQEASLTDKLNLISKEENEITELQNDVTDLLEKSRFDKGEAYYLRALAAEEAANRTHFAPRKKKDTRREALELFKMAASYGKEEAQNKITELEKEI